MITQQYIGQHLDLDQSSISRLCNELCIDWKTTSIDEIRIAYIRHLREQAAGRAAAGDLDLATERAGLAKAQRLRIEMQNAVTKKEMAPVALITEVLAKTAAKIAGQFDAIPGLVRRRHPQFGADVIGLIAEEIAKVRNTVARMSLADLDDDPPPEPLTTPENMEGAGGDHPDPDEMPPQAEKLSRITK